MSTLITDNKKQITAHVLKEHYSYTKFPTLVASDMWQLYLFFMALHLSHMLIKKEEIKSAKFEMHLTDWSTERFVAIEVMLFYKKDLVTTSFIKLHGKEI